MLLLKVQRHLQVHCSASTWSPAFFPLVYTQKDGNTESEAKDCIVPVGRAHLWGACFSSLNSTRTVSGVSSLSTNTRRVSCGPAQGPHFDMPYQALQEHGRWDHQLYMLSTGLWCGAAEESCLSSEVSSLLTFLHEVRGCSSPHGWTNKMAGQCVSMQARATALQGKYFLLLYTVM